jgi:hypothetical protein
MWGQQGRGLDPVQRLKARDHQGAAQQTVARPPQPLSRGLTLPPALRLPAPTFKIIHKTPEVMQDFAGEILLGLQASIQKHQDTLKLFRISEESYFSEFGRANRP